MLDDLRQSGIYKITIKDSGRVYVGSSNNIYNRWKSHRSCLKMNKHHSTLLQRSYNKYGLDCCVFEVIEFCEQSLLVERETFWIKELKSSVKMGGLNYAEASQSTLGTRASPEVCTKISTLLRKRYQSQEARDKTGQSSAAAWTDIRKEEKRLSMLRKWSKEEEINKQKQIMKAVCTTPEHREKARKGQLKRFSDPMERQRHKEAVPHSKKIKNIDTGEIYLSISDFAAKIKVSKSTVKDHMSGARKSSKLKNYRLEFI